MPLPGRLGIFDPLLTTGHATATRKRLAAFLGKPPTIERSGSYGLLAMGNGQAPGTATGLGAAGVITAVTGSGAGRPWEAGLAVFFFAAFLIAGFLAGFFLPSAFVTALRAADFRDAFAMGFFWFAAALRTTFFFDVFFAADFFAVDFFVDFAIRASDF